MAKVTQCDACNNITKYPKSVVLYDFKQRRISSYDLCPACFSNVKMFFEDYTAEENKNESGKFNNC